MLTDTVSALPATQPANRQKRRIATSPTGRRWLTVGEVAERINLSIPSVWRGVAANRLPQPSYPTPAAARWDVDELDRAMERLKAMPHEAKAARRAARIAADQNNAA